MNSFSKTLLLGLLLALGACSTTTLDSDKIDYKSATKAPTLEVPPDLTQLARDNRYVVPGAAVTASGFQAGQTTAQALPTSLTQLGDVRIERAGGQRWLVIDRPAQKLWESVVEFWQDNGFILTMKQADLGIMETDWAENRAKLPQDFIRNSLGRIIDNLYSTGERDKFRTRLERNGKGGTEIYISHRGMIEVYDGKEQDRTVWQPRATDTELETEFLRRLMVKLGVAQEQSVTLMAASVPKKASQVVSIQGQPGVLMDDGFDRAWRRVGLSLDRTNFTVEDRDRSKGVYFVRYVAPSADKAEPGFFSKLFGSGTADSKPQKFRVNVISEGDKTQVTVQNADGSKAADADAARIAKVLADDLQ